MPVCSLTPRRFLPVLKFLNVSLKIQHFKLKPKKSVGKLFQIKSRNNSGLLSKVFPLFAFINSKWWIRNLRKILFELTWIITYFPQLKRMEELTLFGTSFANYKDEINLKGGDHMKKKILLMLLIGSGLFSFLKLRKKFKNDASSSSPSEFPRFF